MNFSVTSPSNNYYRIIEAIPPPLTLPPTGYSSGPPSQTSINTPSSAQSPLSPSLAEALCKELRSGEEAKKVLSHEIRRLSDQNFHLNKRIDYLKNNPSETAQLRKNLETAQSSLEALSRFLGQQNKTIFALREELSAARNTLFSNPLIQEAFQRKDQECEQRIQNLQGSLSSLNSQFATAQETLQRQSREYEQRIQNLQGSLSLSNSQLAKAEKQEQESLFVEAKLIATYEVFQRRSQQYERIIVRQQEKIEELEAVEKPAAAQAEQNAPPIAPSQTQEELMAYLQMELNRSRESEYQLRCENEELREKLKNITS